MLFFLAEQALTAATAAEISLVLNSKGWFTMML